MFHPSQIAPPPQQRPTLHLVTTASQGGAEAAASSVPNRTLELILIAARRGSSFFAEAAVLVLVFGILDYFMLKGRIELQWIVGALGISLGLLAASIAMDFAAHSWISAQRFSKAHP